MTHPLHSPWTLYYQKPNPVEGDGAPAGSDKDYANSIHKIGKFDSVEDFWAYFSHLKRPNEITENIEFHIFRGDIRGMWEDDENRNGGKWILFLKKDFSPQFWEKSVLSLIGELIHEDVLGAVIAIREDTDILSFWTRTARFTSSNNNNNNQSHNDATVLSVAESIAKALDLPPQTQLKFKQHLDSNPRSEGGQRRLFSYVVGGPQKGQRTKRNNSNNNNNNNNSANNNKSNQKQKS